MSSCCRFVFFYIYSIVQEPCTVKAHVCGQQNVFHAINAVKIFIDENNTQKRANKENRQMEIWCTAEITSKFSMPKQTLAFVKNVNCFCTAFFLLIFCVCDFYVNIQIGWKLNTKKHTPRSKIEMQLIKLIAFFMCHFVDGPQNHFSKNDARIAL